jgi:hypothetical protein
MEVWPTNGAVMPFTVPTLGRANLFMQAEDWTGVTENGNTTPDWWFWKYFGTVALSDTNLDSQGNTLLYDYTNGLAPTTFQFTAIATANNYFNTAQVPAQLAVSGLPYWIAILVDDTNFADANWTAFTSSNITVNLGLTEGWHQVWIGLRGHADDPSAAVWQWKRLKLDLTPPLLVVTNPVVSMVSVPLLQVQGYCPEALASLSCDLSNSAGLAANQTALVLDQYYDTNTWAFTTNYFQVFDLYLTNGLNTITLYATDLAGNASTTSFTCLLTNDTDPPVISLGWPQNGQMLCGDSFTVDGWLDDPSASVQVSLVDSNGVASTFGGLVERDGRFWVENLPLAEGTNSLTLTATDVWGNSAATNLTVYQSDLVLGFSPIDPSQLFQPAISLTGTVSDPDCTIWVNGVPGVNNGDGTWQASGVPVNPGGTASFAVAAYPAGQDLQANAASVDKTNVDLPDRLYVASDTQSTLFTYDASDIYGSNDTVSQYAHGWTDGAGGEGGGAWQGAETFSGVTNSGSESLSFSWPASSWPNFVPGTQTMTFTGEPCTGLEMFCSLTDSALWPRIGQDNCEVSDFQSDDTPSSMMVQTYVRHTQTKMKLFTGGKAIPGSKSLFVISGGATELLDKYALPPYTVVGNNGMVYLFPCQPIPNQSVIMGEVGTLGSDGNLYVALPDRTTVGVTPMVPGKDFYFFNVTEQKCKPYVTANGVRLEPDNLADAAAFSVGQKIVLEACFDPTPAGIKKTDSVWSLPGEYRNARKYVFGMDYFIATCYPQYIWDVGQRPPGDTGTLCTTYLNIQRLLFKESTGAWWISEGIKKVGSLKTITFANGQEVTIPFFGQFYVNSPDVYIDGITPRYFTGGWWAGVFLGDLSPGVGGMIYDVNFISDFSGTGAITQLIQADYSPPGPSFSDFRLDGSELYSSGPIVPIFSPQVQKNFYFNDFPGNPLGSRLKATFQDYIRFMPDGDDNIFATIAIVTWNIWGEVTVDGTWAHQETPDPAGPTPSTDFPVWTNSYP